MKNLKITVNGKTYDVAVEEVGAASAAAAPAPAATPAAPSAPVAAPISAPAAAPAPAAMGTGEGKPIICPMPGTIINVLVKVGDAVKKGTVLLILEAMKMENEIQAVEAGTVTGINVRKGDTINADDVMLTIA